MERRQSILSTLDSYKDYAKEYEQRKNSEAKSEIECSGSGDGSIQETIRTMKAKSIQDEIAETLRKIKEQEEANKIKIAEENRRREEKRKKEEEIKAKIAEELDKIRNLENIQAEKIREQEEKRRVERDKMLEEERIRQKKIEDEENKKKLLKKQKEEEDRKRALKEKSETKIKQAQNEAKKVISQIEKRVWSRKEAEAEQKRKLEEEKRKKIAEEEKRLRLVEEEKRKLWEAEMEKERKKAEADRLARLEEDRRIAREIAQRRQLEEEEQKRLKKELEEERLREIERSKKLAMEEKKKNLLKQNEKVTTQTCLERPKKKSSNNPLAQKFEELAKNAIVDDQKQRKKVQPKVNLKGKLSKSKQFLQKLSKESLKASQTIVSKRSKEKLWKTSIEKLKKSRDNLRRSKTCVSKIVEEPSHMSKKDMQNYLISQVLFDGEEKVSTSRSRLDEEYQEKLRKEKEMEMMRKEQEMKRKIEEELQNIKKAEEEHRLKQQEKNFEAYKKEMEKYLDFVCEDPGYQKKKKIVKKSNATTEKKLKLNIKGIKDQFEEGKPESAGTEYTSPTPTVNKLDPMKYLQNTEMTSKESAKKEYVPVIIDKAAFERTVGMFEKEKREEEERKLNEIRIQKRREKMLKERDRLIEEKRKQQEEEQERQRKLEELQQIENMNKYREDEENIELEENDTINDNEHRETIDNNENNAKNEDILKMDIHERIKHELEKIRMEEEIQRKKIEKENKKKSLIRQIQSEIEKIKSVDDTVDDTPAWIKLMTEKQMSSKANKTPMQSAIQRSISYDSAEKTPVEEDAEIPKWIKIFQEKSKRIEEMKEKMQAEKQKHIEKQKAAMKNNASSDQINDKPINKIEGQKDAEIKTLSPNEKASTEDFNVRDSSPVRSKTLSVKDRVRRVKSLILETDPKIDKKEKVKVEKDKANKIKKFFESSHEEKPKAEVKRPKKKIVKVPASELFVPKNNPVARDWKWKTKDSKELYDFINSNKQFLPDHLTDRVDENLNVSANDDISKNEINQEQYEDYIDTLHEYLENDDSNETETIFKDTILAYLDLIEDKPKKRTTQNQKEMCLNPGSLRDKVKLMECSANAELHQKDVVVGKVDTSFLIEQKVEDMRKTNNSVTKSVCSDLKSKYEKLSTDEEPKPLYSMKRKLIPGKENIDSMAWKKQQTEYQWKYKQKPISELQTFIQNSENAQKRLTAPILNKEYVSPLPKIDFASRLAEEEKRMDEFESFMEEIHDYLEKDTIDEAESDFKWQIQSYIDLIENEENQNKHNDNSLWSRNTKTKMPSHKNLKEKLEEEMKEKPRMNENKVGKIDIAKILKSSTIESEEQEKRFVSEIKPNTASKLINAFELDDNEVEHEKVVVKKKIIESIFESNEPTVILPKKVQQDWKYKHKTIVELQNFISSNKDMIQGAQAILPKETIDPADITEKLLQKSKELEDSMKLKEDEFERFMAELENYSNISSSSRDEEKFKSGLKDYLALIDIQTDRTQSNLPKISNAIKVSDIQSRLMEQNENKRTGQKSNAAVGKVSSFFKKSTKESCSNSKIMKENIESLLQPGKAKLLKNSFESQPKLKRSVSEIEVRPGKLKNFFTPQHQEESLIIPKPKRSSMFSFKQEKKKPAIVEQHIPAKKAEKPKVVESAWASIEDPEERKNAILAKYGFKPAKSISQDDDDSDIEDYLNYENTEEAARYEEQLREQYKLYEAEDDSSPDSSPSSKRKMGGSFSSLVNILKTMRQSSVSKTFSESKSKVLEFSDSKAGLSKSEVDLSDLRGTCSSAKERIESANMSRRISNQWDDQDAEYLKEVQTSARKADLEKAWQCSSGKRKHSLPMDNESLPSINTFKTMFERGQIQSEDVHEYVEKRSVVSKPGELSEDDFGGSQTIEFELEALRQSSKMKMLNKLDRGKAGPPAAGSLRRSNSCVGISGEVNNNDLDEDTLRDVSVSNRMVKAMFESSAPKYKFGGSGSNLSLASSQEEVRKGPVMRASVKPKEERKWVMDSINKYFDVIVEEEDEDEDVSCDDDNDDLEDSEYEYSDEGGEEDDLPDEVPEAGKSDYKSSSKIRGLLSSVANRMSGSMNQLPTTDIVQNLKKNLGSRISLRGSNLSLAE